MGHSRRSDPAPTTSGLPQQTDIRRVNRHVSKVPGRDSCSAANWTLITGEMGVADYFRLVPRGNTILNSVKSPDTVSTSILPPCCFTMMS
jgi:hypothetical protein